MLKIIKLVNNWSQKRVNKRVCLPPSCTVILHPRLLPHSSSTPSPCFYFLALPRKRNNCIPTFRVIHPCECPFECNGVVAVKNESLTPHQIPKRWNFLAKEDNVERIRSCNSSGGWPQFVEEEEERSSQTLIVDSRILFVPSVWSSSVSLNSSSFPLY